MIHRSKRKGGKQQKRWWWEGSWLCNTYDHEDIVEDIFFS